MFNELVVVAVTKFSGVGAEPDKNGKESVMLQGIAGRFPNRNVLAGTVAENAGLEVGHTYLVQCRENPANETAEYGKQYNWLKVSELDGLDIVKTCKELGAAQLFTVEPGTQNTPRTSATPATRQKRDLAEEAMK